MDYMVLKPKAEMFTYSMSSQERLAEFNPDGTPKIEYPPEGGMFVYYKGHPFPEKLFPFPEAIYCIDPVKRAIVNTLRFFKESRLAQVLAGLSLFLPGRKKMLISYMYLFASFAEVTVQKIRLKPEGYCRSARNVFKAGMAVRELFPADGKSFSEDEYTDNKYMIEVFTHTLCSIWEFDSAYRYRFQDVLSNLDKVAFDKNPVREILRLMDIAMQRESIGKLTSNLKGMRMALKFLLLNKTVKKILKTFVANLEPAELVLDDGDRYWCYQFGDYEFEGLTKEAREIWYQNIAKQYGYN